MTLMLFSGRYVTVVLYVGRMYLASSFFSLARRFRSASICLSLLSASLRAWMTDQCLFQLNSKLPSAAVIWPMDSVTLNCRASPFKPACKNGHRHWE